MRDVAATSAAAQAQKEGSALDFELEGRERAYRKASQREAAMDCEVNARRDWHPRACAISMSKEQREGST